MADDIRNRQGNCDRLISAAAGIMLNDIGASPQMLLDRILTFCAVHAVAWTGKSDASRAFRQIAERIEGDELVSFEAQREAKH